MKKQPSIAEIFEYNPDAINLIGFPDSLPLQRLSLSLGSEPLLSPYQKGNIGKKTLLPSFYSRYMHERQTFFQRLPDDKIKKYLFDREFPKTADSKLAYYFLDFCTRVYQTIESARTELKPFQHLPEAKKILRRLNNLDSSLEKSLSALNSLDESHTFAIDETTGEIVAIEKMPAYRGAERYRPQESTKKDSYDLSQIKTKMKKAVIDVLNQGKENFKQRKLI